jgi:hypothetical protein
MHMYVCMYARMHVCMYVYMCIIHMHTYIPYHGAVQTSGKVGSGGLVAVSSVKGLFLLRVRDQSVFKAELPRKGPFQPYHDLKVLRASLVHFCVYIA